MINWNFSNQPLLDELNKIDDSVGGILYETLSQINEYDSSLLTKWVDRGLKAKMDSYLVRYAVPLYELLIREKKKNVGDALVVQLLSCISWRTLDNCLDTHDFTPQGYLNSLRASLQLYDYSRTCTTTNTLPALEYHYNQMAEQALFERTRPIEFANIWKRCSIFLFAAEEVAQLNKDNIELYKHYINYSGLAHDTHDFFSDISSGVVSLPVFWMKQINPDEILSINTVKLLYEKVRAEVKPLEEKFKLLKIESEFPLINHLLNESWRTFHDE